MIHKAVLISFLTFVFAASAQNKKPLYDNDYLTKEFHQSRRTALIEKMPEGSVAFFFSAPEKIRSNDVEYQFKQDPDFYYLTGCRETNSMLVIFKDEQDVDDALTHEILFIQDKNIFEERWTGVRMGRDSAKKTLGFKCTKNASDFADFKIDLKKFKTILYTDKFYDVPDDKTDRGDLASLIKHLKLKIEISEAKTNLTDLSLIMAELRQNKMPEEIVLMRKAIKMTCDAHREVMKALEPGMTEYQSQAIMEYMFKKNGSEYPGYPCIVGGAENSCILHYTTNRRKLQKGELLLMDCGAEYHDYSADVTRTIPVSGKFSPEQKIIYNIVLDAQMAGIKKCIAGNDFRDPHKEAYKIIGQKLSELGIIKNPNEAIKYFFHGTSHYLGLDVHDAGLYNALEPNQVITVEPGIYIPAGSNCDPKWWNIGIRIEDDILITTGAPENLSAGVPKIIDEIEALMKQESVFNLIR
jgi:Xaa-Pro aminopeptidase